MTDNIKRSPDPIDVQDLQFKKSHRSQIFEPFSLPPNSNNLMASDSKRGLLYIGHLKKLTVLKPGIDDIPESKLDVDLPDNVTYVSLNCDCTYLALAFSQPVVYIYDASTLWKKTLNLVAQLRISSSAEMVRLMDLRWNPTAPNMLCTIASDHSIGSFQVRTDKQLAPTKVPGLEALCVAWSPKGKQLAVGCKNGNIVQLKPELKIARTIAGPAQPMGEIIALLWISNYQFCAAYSEIPTQTITAVIVDAPKGANLATFTCYDFLLNRLPEQSINPRFYFEYIAEWGVIIAASNDCSEAAVIATSDNGATWLVWQMESHTRAELPMIKCNDSYPVGLAIDRSTTNKIHLDAENVAKHPFPVLHILGTSGDLVSFYIVNLKPESPNICVPPTEVVNIVSQCQAKPAEEVSFQVSATSTPLIKQAEPIFPQPDKVPQAAPSLFGSPTIGGKAWTKTATPSQPGLMIPTKPTLGGEAQSVEGAKSSGFFGTAGSKIGEPKSNLMTSNVEVNKTVGFPLQKEPAKTIDVPAKVAEPVVQTEKKEIIQEKATKPAAKVSPEKKYDDAIYLQFYKEVWTHFKNELESKLVVVPCDIGTEQEKRMIVKKAAENEEGLSDMLNVLTDDLACTKSLLLQSFAWLEEAKSRKMSSSIGEKNKSENVKMKERENCLYYLQTQIQQINNTLDLKWTQDKKRNEPKMKIPNIEFLYMTLLRQDQVVRKQKENLDNIAKKMKSFGKKIPTIANLNQSMSNLNVSSMNRTYADDYGIEMRCKNIALAQKNFSRNKKVLLRDILLETSTRIIKPTGPSSVQDRLHATLSSLATTVKANETIVETPSKPRAQLQPKVLQHQPIQQQLQQQPLPQQPPHQQQQDPLPSLNNLISRLGNEVTPIQSSFQATAAAVASPKGSSFAPVNTQVTLKSKPIAVTQTQSLSSFPKLDVTKSGVPLTKPTETSKDGFLKLTTPSAEQPKVETKAFQNFSIKPVSALGVTSVDTISTTKNTSITSSFMTQQPAFGLSTQPNTTNLFSAKPTGSTFNFGATTAPAPTVSTNQSLLQSTINLGGLTVGLQQPEFSVSSSQTTNAAPVTPMPSPLVFKTPQTSLFAKTVPATTSSPSSIASGMIISPAFCRSTTTTVSTSNVSDKVTSSTAASVTSTTSPAVTQSVLSFGSTQSVITSTPSTNAATVAPSMPSTGLFKAATTSTASTTTTTVSTTPSTFSFFGNSATPTNISTNTTTTTTTTTAASTFSSSPFSGMLSATSSLNFGASPTSPSIFGGKTATTTPGTSIFGGKSATAPGAPNIDIFAKAAEGSSVTFGSLTITATGNNTSSIFGGTTATTTTTAPSILSATPNTTTTPATTSILNASTFTAPVSQGAINAPTFSVAATTGISGFGTPTTSTSTFSTATTSAPVFGAATTSAPTFATATTNVSVFGTPTTGAISFAPPTTATSIFGTPTTTSATTFGGTTTNAPPAFSTFGTPATTPATGFGSPTSTTGSFNSIFGSANASSGSMFGGKSPESTATSMFGGVAVPAFAAPAQNTMFADANKAQQPVFGSSGAGIFGTAGQTASPLGGGMMAGASAVFGQSATFGSKPVFGAPAAEFGSKPVFGSGFSSTAFGGAATGAGFGTTPAMANTMPQMGATGTMDKVFGGGGGNNTFESLASQGGGLSFSSLAQKTTEPQQQAPPAFSGGSSFSSWR